MQTCKNFYYLVQVIGCLFVKQIQIIFAIKFPILVNKNSFRETLMHSLLSIWKYYYYTEPNFCHNQPNQQLGLFK